MKQKKTEKFKLMKRAEMRPTGPGVRRQPKDSFIPPTPVDFHHRHRDSDASSRPSSIGIGVRPNIELYKERSFQQSAISTINSFLSSQNLPISFKSTSPSAKDIQETLKFFLSLLEFPSSKLEDDLPLLLKRLSYPFKLNKSILKSPAAPHQWPSFLALLHWLVQISKFHLSLSSSSSSSSSSLLQNNVLHHYTLNSYLHYIRGDDDAVDDLDRKIRDKILHEKSLAEDKLRASEELAANLEAELQRLSSAPSQKEVLEKDKGMLESDVNKFHKMIGDLASKIEGLEKVSAEREKQLEANLEENKRICEENKELKRRVELQTFNARDVERMRKELQAVERDIGDAELSRNTWEEKSWVLDTSLSHNIKNLEALAMDCNKALRGLKIGNGIQYQLNFKGTTHAEIMGIDYKVTLKPALNSVEDDIKKSSMGKSEELISYQQKSNEIAVRLAEKKNQLEAVQSQVDDMEGQLNNIKKETQDYTSRCYAEAQKMLEDVQLADHDLDIMERQAAEVLKASELKLQEAIKQSEEEIQMHARELFKLVDSVSKYKEHVGSKLSEMKRGLSETATAVSDAYGGSFSAQFG